MRKQVMDGLIVATVLLAGTHLYAQGINRKVIRPEKAPVVVASSARGIGGHNGAGMTRNGRGSARTVQSVPGGAMGNRAGGWTRSGGAAMPRQGGAAMAGPRGNAGSAGAPRGNGYWVQGGAH
jgi:hypothetical protein